MLEGHLCRTVGCIEAVGRTGGGDDGHRAFAVAAIQSLQQVCLLALGGQSCGRAAALHVDDYERKLVYYGQVYGLRLQTYTRP